MRWLICSLFCVSVANAAEVQPVGLVPAGTEVRSGERWLGLFPTEVGWQVRRTQLDVVAWPEGAGAFEGMWDVAAREEVQPLVLFRDLPGVRAGTVSSVSPEVDADGRVLFGPSRVRPWLELEADATGVQGDLVLHRNGERLLVAPWTATEGHPSLLWAGDLDGDGHLDLVLEHGRDDTVRTSIWLSGAARAGQAVAKVAEHRAGDVGVATAELTVDETPG
jgi:hypothetical protein